MDNSNKNKNDIGVRNGDIWKSRLIGEGSVQRGISLVIVVGSNVSCITSPNCTVLILSKKNPTQETHVLISANRETGLIVNSIAMAETITTISKKMLIHRIGFVNNEIMKKIKASILKHLEID